MGLHTNISPEHEKALLQRARELKSREPKTGWGRLADSLGVGREWLKRRMIPGYAEKMRGYWVEKYHFGLPDRITKEELQQLKSTIPEDTRDVTGRICGDPVFERSALYQKMSGGQA